VNRADLRALTTDVLATLANRGLVKRAAREVDAGDGPAVREDPDGTVRGTFGDGVEVAFPVGATLDTASCSCPAAGVCRHRIGLVLAYQATAATEQADPQEPAAGGWSPGSFDDEELARALGTRTVTAARRRLAAGYSALLDRGADGPPCAELAACVVRFLVPGELGYAHTGAEGPDHGQAVALAVWAFRAADERGLREGQVRLDVGGGPKPRAERTGMEPAVELATELLFEGATHAGPVLGAALRRMHRTVERQGLHWPADALYDLSDQLDAYTARAARYDPVRYAALVTELHARQRATAGGGLRSQLLGTDEQGGTSLRRVRLVGLGCRVGGPPDQRVAELFFAHADDGTVFVMRRRWNADPQSVPTGHDLASRPIAGASLGALATANLVSESASRSASRVVNVTSGQVGRTTVTPVGTAWAQLPHPVMVRDLDLAARALDDLPPWFIRPRIEAEFVRVLAVAEVREVGYHPGDQRLDALVTDAAGRTATVSAEYRDSCPGALDALAGALQPSPSFISGSLRRGRGTLVLDPVAVLTPHGMVVPDLAPGDGSGRLPAHLSRPTDRLGATLAAAQATMAEVAHRGLRQLTPGLRTRVEEAGSELARVGLRTSADLVTAFRSACGPDADPEVMTRAWVEAQIQLLTAAEFR
jgi:hypothetical protein